MDEATKSNLFPGLTVVEEGQPDPVITPASPDTSNQPAPAPTPAPASAPTPTPTPTPATPGSVEPKPADPAKPTEELKYTASEFGAHIFGEGSQYKSLDELKALKVSERLTELQKISQEHTQLKSEYQKAQDRIKLLDSPKYLAAAKFAAFSEETGIEDFNMFRQLESLDPTKLNEVQTLVLLDRLKYGENGRSQEEFMKQFNLGDYATDDGEGNKIEDESDKKALKREALAAMKELSTYKEKIAKYQPEAAKDTSAEKAAHVQAWKSALPNLVANVKQINFPVKSIKDIPIEDALQLTVIDQQNISDRMLGIATERGLPLNNETANEIYQEAMKDVVLDKLVPMFTLFGEKLYAKAEMALKLKYTNSSVDTNNPDRKPPDLANQIPADGTTARGAAEEAARSMGIKL